jgi:hypothetical protein
MHDPQSIAECGFPQGTYVPLGSGRRFVVAQTENSEYAQSSTSPNVPKADPTLHLTGHYLPLSTCGLDLSGDDYKSKFESLKQQVTIQKGYYGLKIQRFIVNC